MNTHQQANLVLKIGYFVILLGGIMWVKNGVHSSDFDVILMGVTLALLGLMGKIAYRLEQNTAIINQEKR